MIINVAYRMGGMSEEKRTRQAYETNLARALDLRKETLGELLRVVEELDGCDRNLGALVLAGVDGFNLSTISVFRMCGYRLRSRGKKYQLVRTEGAHRFNGTLQLSLPIQFASVGKIS